MRLFPRNPQPIAPSAWASFLSWLLIIATSTGAISTGQNSSSRLTAAYALIERGVYTEAVSLFKMHSSSGEIDLRERLRISHVLNYLLLFSNNAAEAVENAKASYRLAQTGGLLAEAETLRTEITLIEAYQKGLELRISGDILSSNILLGEADRLATALATPAYQLKIADSWSLNYLNSKTDPDRYLALNLKALDLAIGLNYRIEISKAAKKIGTFYALKNNYSRALGYYLRALNSLDPEYGHRDMAMCLNNIAGVYLSLGDYAKAKAYLLEAKARLPEGASGELEISLLINLGNLFNGLFRRFGSNDFSKAALECYSASKAMQNAPGGGRISLEVLAGTAEVYICQRRFADARRIIASALGKVDVFGDDPIIRGRFRSLQGELSIQTGAFLEAESNFKETLAIARQTESTLLAFQATFGLGRLAEARGDLDQALEAYYSSLRIIWEESSDIANDVQRADFFGRGRDPFQALVRLYLNRAKGDLPGIFGRELFRLAESMRGWSVAEFKAELSGTQLSPEHDAEDAEEAELISERIQVLKRLAFEDIEPEARRRLEVRIIQIDDLLDTKAVRRPRTGVAMTSATPEILQDRVLDERTAILEYLLSETTSILFCLTRNSFHIIALPSSSEIEDSLTGYLSYIEDPDLSAIKGLPAARRLYDALLSPAEPFLSAKIDRLIVVPDGGLYRLPFEALVMNNPDGRTSIYVCDRYEVSYAANAASLRIRRLKPDSQYSKTALAFSTSEADPRATGAGRASFSPAAILDDIYDRRGFSLVPLPYAKDEVADLAKRFRPSELDVFWGQKATETALKALDLSAYRLIHFACHAFSDDSFPLRSSLVLSPDVDEREDGYLQASEICRLRTNADLVVLSACQTGKGKIVMNEGNLGLPRVFFFAGARSVISTLWPVNDKTSSVFMRYFYEGYLKGKGKAEALRAAKMAMQRSKYSHPYFWAGYVLTGEF